MGSVDGTSISTSHLAYKWKVEMKRRGGIKEKRENEMWGSEKREKLIEIPEKLVIRLLSNIKEQTSSDFARDDIFSITFLLFILLSSESFPVFVSLTKAQFSHPHSTNSLFLGLLGLSPST